MIKVKMALREARVKLSTSRTCCLFSRLELCAEQPLEDLED